MDLNREDFLTATCQIYFPLKGIQWLLDDPTRLTLIDCRLDSRCFTETVEEGEEDRRSQNSSKLFRTGFRRRPRSNGTGLDPNNLMTESRLERSKCRK
jgi:hypothetical protein